MPAVDPTTQQQQQTRLVIDWRCVMFAQEEESVTVLSRHRWSIQRCNNNNNNNSNNNNNRLVIDWRCVSPPPFDTNKKESAAFVVASIDPTTQQQQQQQQQQSGPSFLCMPPHTEEDSCRRRQHECGGIPGVGHCETCKRHERIGDRALGDAAENGTDEIAGACTNKSTLPPIAEVGRRKRRARVTEEASTTGMLFSQKAAKGHKDEKRRRSFEAGERAETLIAKGKAKPGLMRQAVAFVVGKESTVMPRQNANKTQSKSTAARTRKPGGGPLNGAACLPNQQDPTTLRNAMVKHSVASKPTLAAKDHPFAAAAAEAASEKAATKAAGKAAAEAAAAVAAAAQAPPPPPTTTTTTTTTATTAAAQPTLAGAEAAKDKAFVDEAVGNDDPTHKARLAMCQTFVDAAKEHVNPKDRRPHLACFSCCTKPQAEKTLDVKPSECEFHQAKIHAKCPGPLKPVPVVEQSKQRIPQATLQSFFRLLETPGNLQRCAFGAKMLDIAKGKSTTEIEAIDAMKKIESLAAGCTQALDSELSVDQSTLPDSHERCQCLERSTRRRRMKERNHVGRRQFAPDGSLPRSTVVKLVKTLAGGETKRLAGLDDAKALKGRDNLQLMRDAAESVVDDIGERSQITKDIDDSEAFHQTDCIDHLQQKSSQKCCCLSCGFSREKEKLCSDNSSHGEACVECARAHSVINKLERRLAAKVKESSNNGNVTITQKQKLDEHNFELTQARKDLTQCRSHLARHKAEGDFHERELQALDDDTAIATCDWKMKLPACFFGENQAEHFGKKAATSCIGFVVATKPADEEVRKKGLVEVQFAMMLTDDAKQGEHNVACAEAEIHRSHLPDHIAKVEKGVVFDDGDPLTATTKSLRHNHWMMLLAPSELVHVNPQGFGDVCNGHCHV